MKELDFPVEGYQIISAQEFRQEEDILDEVSIMLGNDEVESR